MNEATYTLLYKEAIEALHGHRLHDALSHISGLLFNVNDWALRTEYDEIQQTYELMLNFMRQGTADPERHTLYLRLLQRSYQLADQLLRTYEQGQSTKLFYEKWRTQEALTPRPTLGTLQLSIGTLREKRAEATATQIDDIDLSLYEHYSRLFVWLWTSPTWRDEEREKVAQMLKTLAPNEQAVSLSAIFLHILQQFDYNRLVFLFDCCRDGMDEPLRQRALVCAVLGYIRHADRMADYPSFNFLLENLAEQPNFVNSLCTLQMQFFLTLETRNVERKMREEIIPELMKSKRFRPTKFGFEEVDDALTQEDINPDWKQKEEDKNLDKKLMEIAQLQQDGADLYMGTFAQLKSFPFFQDIMNWFYPFDASHLAVRHLFHTQDGKPSLMMRAFFNSGTLCDSDKYSFCFVSQNIPPAQREMMEAKISSAISDEGEGLMDKLIAQYTETADEVRKTYIQNLYRFFKLFPRRNEFADPFQQNLYLMEFAPFAHLLDTPECLRRLADFMLRRKYYANAVQLFEQLNLKENVTAEIFQKMGYCCQMDCDYARAIDYYRQADILDADVQWTLRHLAQCYRHLGQAEQALACYGKLETMEPENLQLLMKIGECHVLLRQYDEAFARFFKVDYLSPDTTNAARAIAWCSFLTGKMEQAEKYYQRLLANQPKAEDCLNAGHTAWAAGDVPLAVERYQKYREMKAAESHQHSVNVNFDADRKELNARGISDEDIELMRDVLG